MDDLERPYRKKFEGQFDSISKKGTDVGHNPQRFRPLQAKGKPLWEFKEKAHRIYCLRTVIGAKFLVITIFSGWTKQKEGRTEREDNEIAHALRLYAEYVAETESKGERP